MPRITLIGYRGTGKSTVAALLSDLLGCGWVDADHVLEDKLGCSIAELIRDRGEPAFRDEESLVLAELMSRGDDVLATGGGVVLRPHNRAILRSRGRPVVWLTAPAGTVHGRIMADPSTPQRRPSLAVASEAGPPDPLAEVIAALATRDPLYRECADVIIDASGDSPAVVARSIAAWLADRWPLVERPVTAPPGRPGPSSGPAPRGRP